jgi:hypothetical protein
MATDIPRCCSHVLSLDGERTPMRCGKPATHRSFIVERHFCTEHASFTLEGKEFLRGDVIPLNLSTQ